MKAHYVEHLAKEAEKNNLTMQEVLERIVSLRYKDWCSGCWENLTK